MQLRDEIASVKRQIRVLQAELDALESCICDEASQSNPNNGRIGYTVYEHLFPDGKSYIGLTSNPVEFRWRNGAGYNNVPKMKEAIERFGWENVESKIHATGLEKAEAYRMEAKLIRDRNSVTDGYNTIPSSKSLQQKTSPKPVLDTTETQIIEVAKQISRNPIRDSSIALLRMNYGLRITHIIALNAGDYEDGNLYVSSSLSGQHLRLSELARQLLNEAKNVTLSDYRVRKKYSYGTEPLFISERISRISYASAARVIQAVDDIIRGANK